MDTGLANKVAIVTGATANIGKAISLALGTEGMCLLLVGRDSAQGTRVAKEAVSLGAPDARFICVDMLEADSGQRIADAADGAFGTVDVLVNNVGGNVDFGLFAESDPDIWDRDIDLNFKTNLRMTRAVLPGMIARQSGRIVNIGSTAGEVGDYMLATYSASKGAVHAFTKVLAKEVGEFGVTVNCVAPYATMPEDPARDTSSGSRYHPDTGIITRAIQERGESLARMIRPKLLPRGMAKPEEIAAAVVYLASERASFVTGQVHFVDGGTLL